MSPSNDSIRDVILQYPARGIGSTMDTWGWLQRHFGAAIASAERPWAISIWSPVARWRYVGSDLSEAASIAAQGDAAGADVYYGVCLLDPAAVQPGGRGTRAAVIAVPALWADLDVGTGGPKRRFASIEEARRFLDSIGLPPTDIVISGGGVHAYWHLDEPLWITDDESRRRAEALITGWLQRLQRYAAPVVLDSVGDLPRVLRLPGTRNHKYDPPRRCEHIPGPVAAYSLADIEPLVATTPEDTPPQNNTTPAGVVVRSDAQPPARKLAALAANDPQFVAALQRNRRDLHDQSASGHDMSLATRAALAGWTEQEIVDLLVAVRRERGENHKHDGYYIQTARRAMESARAAAQSTDSPQSDTRDDALAYLSQVLRVPIVGMRQSGTVISEAKFSLVLADGRTIDVGTGLRLVSQTAFRTALAVGTGVFLDAMPRKKWHKVCRALFAVNEVVPIPEQQPLVQLAEWIESYGSEASLAVDDEERIADAIASGDPFRRKGKLHIHAASLFHYVRIRLGDTSLSMNELYHRLRAAGWTSTMLHATINGHEIAKRYWREP